MSTLSYKNNKNIYNTNNYIKKPKNIYNTNNNILYINTLIIIKIIIFITQIILSVILIILIVLKIIIFGTQIIQFLILILLILIKK
jgi:hypothetical protein